MGKDKRHKYHDYSSDSYEKIEKIPKNSKRSSRKKVRQNLNIIVNSGSSIVENLETNFEIEEKTLDEKFR